MRRRAVLISGLGVAATGAARAEPSIRVGVLGPDEQPRFAALVEGLHQGLLARGYAPGRIELLEARVARGDSAGAEAAARALRQQGVAAIFVIGSQLAMVARAAAPDVPIVFITPGDPVASGLVASLARPGGLLTGVTFEFPELSGKRLELIRDVVGSGRVVVVVADPRDASPRQALAVVRQAAPALGMTLDERPIGADADLPAALAALPGAAALLVIPGGSPTAHHARLIGAARAAKVLTVFPARSEATADAVLTYGTRDADVARDASRLIDRIAKGARPADLPVERPTRLALVVNLRAARAIDRVLPPSVLARADEVIE
jgi:putative ABC transport system substrate-binding protein